MSNLKRRLIALEGGRSRATHEEWVDAMERADLGERVDFSKLPTGNPADLAKLR
jgi:hypothetical protein